ncbi:MAG TPA: response regulator transcription factor [Acidimicrobiales bacterium]
MPLAASGRAVRERRREAAPETTVLVVDDQRTFAEAVGLAIDSQRGLRCVDAVGSAEQALEALDTSCPDVVLLDLALPGMGGLDAIAGLKRRCPACRILVLTVDTSRRSIVAAAAAGADGFLPKDTPFAGIIRAVRATDSVLVTDDLLEQIVHLRPEPAAREAGRDGEPLTEREHQVLRGLARGEAVKEVARQLGISVHTCRGHVRAIHRKLGVHSQLAAVVAAARRGLLADPVE